MYRRQPQRCAQHNLVVADEIPRVAEKEFRMMLWRGRRFGLTSSAVREMQTLDREKQART